MRNNKQNVALGFSLAMLSAVMWGLLPIAMKQLLTDMTPQTIVFIRFCISTIILGGYLIYRHQLPKLRVFRHYRWLYIFLIGVFGLVANFILFSSGLSYLTPTTSQVIVQLSPIGMIIASIVLLKERLRITQGIGAVVLFIGLILYFHNNLSELFTKLTDFTWGIILCVSAALVWVAYGIAQKLLLRRLGAQQILFLIYLSCAIVLVPFADVSEVKLLSHFQLACLFFCGLNTIIGYGALAEAMSHWQASQVSAITTLTPLFTLLFSDIFALLWPSYFVFQSLDFIGYFGAIMVVAGAMCVAMGHLWWPNRKKLPSDKQ